MSTTISDRSPATAPDAAPRRRWRMTRRGFLIGLGATGGALLLGWQLGKPALRLFMAEQFDSAEGGGGFGSIDTSPSAWFVIAPDNTVTVYIPKIEMGQGIHTALAQIAADELDVAWENVRVAPATTAVGPFDSSGTTGSFSVMTMWQPLRETAATLRTMLVNAAAAQLGVDAAGLVTAAGVVSARTNPDQALTYGEIVAAHSGDWTVPETVLPLKSADQFSLIGRSLPRVDFQDKLTGRAVYGLDVRADGMLYGAVAYAPTVAGKLRRARPGTAADVPGVVQVVIEDNFAGVVATSRAAAEAGVNALELTWDDGPALGSADIAALTTVGEGNATVIQKVGDVRPNLAADATGVAATLIAEYRTPLAAHAHLEPQSALVDVRDDGVTAWVSTQLPAMVQGDLAKVLGRKEEEITINPTYVGGGFGRKVGSDAAGAAARLSRAAGRPVHVAWTRQQEFRDGYLRPPTHHVLRGALAADARITAFDHQQASGDVAFPFVPGFFKVLLGADFGAVRGARTFYDIPHLRTVAWRTPLPLRTGWWRGLGLMANVFAIESFIDEMAHAAGVDPLAFRLRHLPADATGDRLRTVLTTVAAMAGWDRPAPAGRGRGLALCIDAGTVVAQVAEVSLVDGQPRVHHVWCAVDPGLPVNPDGVIAQTQGGIVMGLSSVLFEQIDLVDGRITATNFNAYPLITMKETPAIDVTVLRSGDEPFGMGEPPIGPIAAAVGNAVFDLTGTRLRELPLRLPA